MRRRGARHVALWNRGEQRLDQTPEHVHIRVHSALFNDATAEQDIAMSGLHPTRSPIRTLLENDALRVRWLEGRSDRMVVVFGGVQHNLGGVPMDEFTGSVSEAGETHVVFVNDLKCTWYSTPGLSEQIVETISNLVKSHSISDLRTVGNSMGGYGAVLFAGRLGVKRALAISPQVSMHPAAISEPRWMHFRPDFGDDLSEGLHVCLPPPPTDVVFLFGKKDKGDQRQAALLPAASAAPSNLHIFSVKGCGHDAVKQFKQAKLLRDIIRIGISGSLTELPAVLRTFEKKHHTPLRDLLARVKRSLLSQSS